MHNKRVPSFATLTDSYHFHIMLIKDPPKKYAKQITEYILVSFKRMEMTLPVSKVKGGSLSRIWRLLHKSATSSFHDNQNALVQLFKHLVMCELTKTLRPIHDKLLVYNTESQFY